MRELRRTGEEEKRFDDMMKITFLLGSAVSVPAGFPTVNELTESVLLGDGIVKQDGNDSTANDSSQSHDGHNRLLFLHWLKAQAMARYVDDPNRQINYEDLAYLAGQIADDIDYEYENPAIHQFVLKAPTELQGFIPTVNTRHALRELATTTVTYIRRTVIGVLATRQETIDTSHLSHLHFFTDACTDDSVEQVDIFTVNHDTLLEKFLNAELDETFSVVDGLRDHHDGSRRWDPAIYDDPKRSGKRVNLFKLHGTVDWIRRLRFNQQDRFIGTYPNDSSEGRYRAIGEPLILLGTFNKLLRYHAQPFLELHYRFMRALEDPARNSVIVCGYGFGDKGVNTRIVEWMQQSPNNRLLTIDRATSQKVHEKARGAIQNVINAILPNPTEVQMARSNPLEKYVYEKWRGNYLVRHLPRAIEDVNWEEVRSLITGPKEAFLASRTVET